jgi:hypothetical protein
MRQKEITVLPMANLFFNGDTGEYSGIWEFSLIATGNFNFISLSWDMVPGAIQYRVYRSGNFEGPFNVLRETTTSTEFEDADSSQSRRTNYYYRVSAYYNGIEIARSNRDSAFLTDIVTRRLSSSEIEIRWLVGPRSAVNLLNNIWSAINFLQNLLNAYDEGPPVDFFFEYYLSIYRSLDRINWIRVHHILDPQIHSYETVTGIRPDSNIDALLFGSTALVDLFVDSGLSAGTTYHYRLTWQKRAFIPLPSWISWIPWVRNEINLMTDRVGPIIFSERTNL